MQWKIIRSILYDKRDNCVVMATGLTLNMFGVSKTKHIELGHVLSFSCFKLVTVSSYYILSQDITDLSNMCFRGITIIAVLAYYF